MVQIINNADLDNQQLATLEKCLRMDYGEEIFKEDTDKRAEAFAAFCGKAIRSAITSSPLEFVLIDHPEHLGVHIVEYRRLGGVKILVANYHFFRFLADYIWYQNDPSYEAFVSFFCKSLIPLERQAGRDNMAAFYAWIQDTYGKPMPQAADTGLDFLSSALFILFHETTHLSPGIRDTALKLLEYQEELTVAPALSLPKKQNTSLSEISYVRYKLEAVCDFTALNLLCTSGYARDPQNPAEHELSYAFMALSALSIQQAFQQMTSPVINARISKLDEVLAKLNHEVLNCRFFNIYKMIQLFKSGHFVTYVTKEFLTDGMLTAQNVTIFYDHMNDFLGRYGEYQDTYNEAHL